MGKSTNPQIQPPTNYVIYTYYDSFGHLVSVWSNGAETTGESTGANINETGSTYTGSINGDGDGVTFYFGINSTKVQNVTDNSAYSHVFFMNNSGDFVHGQLGTGNDSYIGGNGKDALYAGTGYDYLSGQNGSDWLTGGSGDASSWSFSGGRWTGTSHYDTLVGGNGSDVLVDGTLPDVFVYRTHLDSPWVGHATNQDGSDYTVNTNNLLTGGVGHSYNFASSPPWDVIPNFNYQKDIIDFSVVDGFNTVLTGAPPGQSHDTIHQYLNGTVSDTHGNELQWSDQTTTDAQAGSLGAWNALLHYSVWTNVDNTFLYADTNGDGVADMKIQVNTSNWLDGNPAENLNGVLGPVIGGGGGGGGDVDVLGFNVFVSGIHDLVDENGNHLASGKEMGTFNVIDTDNDGEIPSDFTFIKGVSSDWSNFALTSDGTLSTGASNVSAGTYMLDVTADDSSDGDVSDFLVGVFVGSASGDLANKVGETTVSWLMYGMNGADTLDGGSAMFNSLVGGSGNDTITGGDGSIGPVQNTLVGGGGADTLNGGAGAFATNIFEYLAKTDSQPNHGGSTNADTITLGGSGATNLIDFSQIAALTNFDGQVNAGDAIAAGHLAYYESGGNTFLDANTSGSSETAGAATGGSAIDMEIVLTGVSLGLTAGTLASTGGNFVVA